MPKSVIATVTSAESTEEAASAVVRKFGSTASTHGIKQAIGSKGAPRIFWVGVFVLALGCCITFVVLNTIQYFEYGVAVTAKLTAAPQKLPAITVCNLNPYLRSAVQADPNIGTLMNAYKQANKKLGS